MSNIEWSKLNSLQLGAFAEAYAKAVFQSKGFSTYSSDVDDRGVDFLAESQSGAILKVQVKSIRGNGYVFMTKEHFKPEQNYVLCLLRFGSTESPDVFIIPSKAWMSPNALLVSRDYGEGMKSRPEWGVNISRKNEEMLERYSAKSFFDVPTERG